MLPLPYRMPSDDIYSGGQQFGTLPNPDHFGVSPLAIASGGMPEGMSPFAMQMVNQYRQGPQPGRVEYEDMQPSSPGFDNPDIRAYQMGRYLNMSNGLDRNMRMRDQRVQQADADNGVDRFFSRVVAPIAGGAGGAMGSKTAMKGMQDWQNGLNQNIQRNRVFQAQHINDLQQNQTSAYNQAIANDPTTLKNQQAMMRAYYYGQGVIGRNQHYLDSDANKANQIVNQRGHWDAQEGHWGRQDDNANRRTDIYKQNADTSQEYKRGMLKINQQRADTYQNLSEEQQRHLGRIDQIAQGRLDEMMRIDNARIDKIYDDMATGAVNRQKGMAQIDQIYNNMDVKQQKIQFDYDKLSADIEGRNLDRDQRDRAEDGRNRRAASGVSYSKDGAQQYKMDEGFRAQYGAPLQVTQSAPAARGRVTAPVNRNSVVVPRRPQMMDNGLVPPPPAVPVQPQDAGSPIPRRGGGIAAALQHYRETPASQKAVMRAYFISKYGQDPDAK